MRATVLLVPLVALVLAVPAQASSTLDDPCGDAGRIHDSAGFRVDLRDDRVPGFDLDEVAVADRGEPGEDAGVDVVMRMCADLPAPELQGSIWLVAWRTSDRCTGSVRLNDVLRAGTVVRRAFVAETCSTDGQEPVTGRAYSTASTVYDVELPLTAWSVDGDTVRFTLEPDALGQAAAQVESGRVLRSVSATTRDARWLTYADLGAQQLGPFTYPGTRQTGPGAEDHIAASGDHPVA